MRSAYVYNYLRVRRGEEKREREKRRVCTTNIFAIARDRSISDQYARMHL